jgi:micrococcal nuclease
MSKPSEDFVRNARIIKVVDGDTLRLEVDLGFTARITHDIRLSGLNTPEPRGPEGPAGRFVTREVEKLIYRSGSNEVIIRSKEFTVGKYGRCVCEVWVGDICLNDFLLDRKLAWTANEEGASDSFDITELTGIPLDVRERVSEAWAELFNSRED